MKLSSKLHISNAESFANDLLALVGQSKSIELDISDVDSADTASIQVLCALQKSLETEDSEIVWIGKNEPLYHAANQLGVAGFLGLSV